MIMRVSLFDREQSVLLVGEGNFSFSVELVKLDLNLKLTSTCFEDKPEYSSSEENVRFLKHKGVQVLLNIDATCLSKYQELKGCTFHRIVFNFPHVGGKTKIQLNRELLCNFFSSCAPLLSQEGAVIVSLCRGQGGSCKEEVHREYADTWKAVEMAAHGGFVLGAVEPWLPNSPLGSYRCIGRRSLDSSFQREGAMVHIFRFAPITFQFKSVDEYLDLLKPQQMDLPQGSVTCSHLERILLKKDLLSDNSSTLYNLLESFIMYGIGKNLQIKTRKLSSVSDKGYLLNISEIEILLGLYEQKEVRCNTNLHLLWGTAFRKVGCDFSLAPASCYFGVVGLKSVSLCHEWLTELGCSCEITSLVISKVAPNICLLSLDTLAIHLFKLSGWHELWASGAEVVLNEKGILVWQSASISPPVFTFDISIASQHPPDVNAICNVLWQIAGEMVQCIEIVDEYKSPEGWFSKCIRVTYCSFEMALHRSWVVKLQQEVIGPVLEHHLNVTVR